MKTKRILGNSSWRLLIACPLASACLYFFATHYYQFWWCTWVAPIPALWIIQKHSLRTASIISLLIGLTGHSSIWFYLNSENLLSLFYSWITLSLSLTATLLITRYLVKRSKTLASIFIFPALTVLFEYVINQLPLNTFGNIATSQTHYLLLIQLLSITGVYGITFIISLFASCFVYTLNHWNDKKRYKKAWIIFLIIFTIIYCYGRQCFAYEHPSSSSVKVALVALPIKQNNLSEYLKQIKTAGLTHARFIMTPGKAILINSKQSEQRAKQLLSGAAQQTHAYIIFGWEHQKNNRLWIFSPKGNLIINAKKNNQLLMIHDKKIKIGIIIPNEKNPYKAIIHQSQLHAGLLLIPDPNKISFDKSFLQMKLALINGVIANASVAHIARIGWATINTHNGLLLGASISGKINPTLLFSDIPVSQGRSFYATHGDWFVIVCIILLCLSAFL